MERVKEGIGDKFGLLIQGLSVFVVGFIVAFVYSWNITLVMLSILPILIGSCAITEYVIKKIFIFRINKF